MIKKDKNDVRIDTQGSATFRTKHNDDINNRLNSFLDFSTILNNKNVDEKMDERKFKYIDKSNLWEVSSINFKNVSFICKKWILKIYDVIKKLNLLLFIYYMFVIIIIIL